MIHVYVPPLQIGDVVPRLEMRDEHGRAASWRTWPGSTLVVAFTYTRCRDGDACPLVSAKFAALQRDLLGTPVHLVEVTIDPAHDTPAVLLRYGRRFGAESDRWSLLTGEPRAVDDVLQRFDIVREGDASGTLRHAERVFILSEDGRVADRIDGDAWAPKDVSAAARSVANLASSPVRRITLFLERGVGAVCAGGTSGVSIGVALALFVTLLGTGAVVFRRLVHRILAST